MKRNEDLANRLRAVLLDGRWIANTNYKEQLEGLHWALATQKIADLNTIAALTFHITYYMEGVLQVLRGGPLEIRDKYSFDVPEINSQKEWDTLIDRFLDFSRQFTQCLEQMDPALLDAVFVDEKYGSYERNITGIIEHSYYHLGKWSY
ncbi:MAG: DinB family protein [Bacteroidota bacterium]